MCVLRGVGSSYTKMKGRRMGAAGFSSCARLASVMSEQSEPKKPSSHLSWKESGVESGTESCTGSDMESGTESCTNEVRKVVRKVV